MALKKSYKLDIFKVLKNISNSNLEYFDSLTEEEQKSFTPLVIQRWLTTNNPLELYMINEYVNEYVVPLSSNGPTSHYDINHKKLLYNLMTICTGKNGRYTFPKRKSDIKFKKSTEAVAKYLNYSMREVKDILQFYTNDDIIEIAEELGLQKTDITDIKKELKNRNAI